MGIELFERAVGGGAQLLKAEIASAGGRGDRLSSLLLTFDVGRILVTPEPATGSLSIEYVEARDAVPPGLRDASEEEPWWRVLGQPLTRTWSPGAVGPAEDAGADAVCIQFRADDHNPRVVSLQARGGAVSVRLETPPA